jgi:ABC-2 type transport system permease protein
MLRDALFLARMDIFRLARSRETILWTFVMPVMFFWFLGSVTSRGPMQPDTRDPIAVAVPESAGWMAGQVIARLEARGYRIARESTPEAAARYRRRLEIPAHFTESVLAGKPVRIPFTRRGQSMDADYDRIRVSRAVYTVLADLVVLARDGDPPTPERFAALAAEPRNLSLEVKPAGRRLVPPSGFEQSVPGSMVMFTLLVLFTSGAVTLTIERNQGILRRLASSPMRRGAVVLGKWMARMAFGLVQIGFAMLAGTLLFGVRWGSQFAAILLVLVAYAALAASLGMLLGNLGRTEGQVIGVGVIASNLLAALGGCWWPIEITPLWAQKLALAFPTGWAMDALHKLMSFGAPAAAVLPHTAVLLAAAALAGYAVTRSFRFQ